MTVPGVPTDLPPTTALKNLRGWPFSSRNKSLVEIAGLIVDVSISGVTDKENESY